MSDAAAEDRSALLDETAQFLAALTRHCGADVVITDEAEMARRRSDWSGLSAGKPLAIARPRDTADVSRVLAFCERHGRPVVVQGGLTGLAGAANALDGEVVLSMERMQAIEEVDVVSGVMTVQAGAVLQAIQQAAEAAGLYFPVDLGARGSCTIGGMMGTNAGGNRVIKYGMMREQVLGVEAVLPDGRIIGSLHRMLKNNSGYDLKNLLIGSEGTLAVITRAVLRLRAAPTSVSTAWCGLGDFHAVTLLLRRAQAELTGGVSAFEVMWPSYYDFVLTELPQLRRPLAGSHRFNVLLESEGPDAEVLAREFEGFLSRALEDGLLEDAAIALSKRDALDFWAIRDAPGEFPAALPNLMAFDVSFAIADVATAAERIEASLKTSCPGALALIYGHLGDGNIHLIVNPPEPSPALVEAIERTVYDVVSELRGSVSAEHGIGLKKKSVLGRTRTADEISAMAAIKFALDPKGILGFGRIFDV